MSANYARDDIDRYFSYNIHIPTKTMYLGSVEYDSDDGETGTDHGMAEMAIKGLHILDGTRPDKPITIIMNNPGGDEYHGMAIYDAIQACQSEVHIRVFGHAMSMSTKNKYKYNLNSICSFLLFCQVCCIHLTAVNI